MLCYFEFLFFSFLILVFSVFLLHYIKLSWDLLHLCFCRRRPYFYCFVINFFCLMRFSDLKVSLRRSHGYYYIHGYWLLYYNIKTDELYTSLLRTYKLMKKTERKNILKNGKLSRRN